MAREPFSGHLDLLLLAALTNEPLHGYAIIERVRRTSGGRFDYPALHRLEAEGLLASRWNGEGGRRRRRVYELTPKGVKALDGRRRDWERFSRSVGAVLEGT